MGLTLCDLLFVWEKPGSVVQFSRNHSSQRNLIASVMNTVVTPMLNPFIYILTNKDVMGALGSILHLGEMGLLRSFYVAYWEVWDTVIFLSFVTFCYLPIIPSFPFLSMFNCTFIFHHCYLKICPRTSGGNSFSQWLIGSWWRERMKNEWVCNG